MGSVGIGGRQIGGSIVVDILWSRERTQHRQEVARILREITSGAVTEVDLAALHNFCMVSLQLQHKVNRNTWKAAERDALTIAFLRDVVEDV
jgi:hypothetical protein